MSVALLDRQQQADWHSLQSRVRSLGEPLRFAVEVLPARAALNYPLFGPAILQMLSECHRSACVGGDRECHGCCRPWTRQRSFGAVGIVEFLNIPGAGLVGLCTECWSRPDR